MKKVFLAASGVFASIPGLGIMVSGLGTPPGHSKLFGGIIEAFGALAILLLAASKTKIQRLTMRQVVKAAIVLAISCFCVLVLYLQLSSFCILEHPVHGTVYYPLWTSGHLAQMVERVGGRYAAVDRYGAYPVTKAIQEAPGHPLPIVVTTAILLFFYQGIFTSLAVAFGILGIRSDKAGLDSIGATEVRRSALPRQKARKNSAATS